MAVATTIMEFHAPPPLISLPPAPSSASTTSSVTTHARIAPLTKLQIQPVGRAYYAKLRQHLNTSTNGTASAATNSKTLSHSPSTDRIAASDPRYSYATLMKQQDLEDYYALLGLAHLSYSASDDEIRKSYKIVSLVIHPDKAQEPDREHASELFKATQKAYETLSDLTKRRAYDSSLDFDDDIPEVEDVDSKHDFYSVFAPVFLRNALFSTIKPVPQLGTTDSSHADVNQFYDFWFSFKSWRDFSYLNEYQLEQASGRDEKRWMERENAKLQAGKRKEEVARIRKLVERAYKLDPRIQKQAAEVEAERARKKAEAKAALIARKQQEQAAQSSYNKQAQEQLQKQYAAQQAAKAKQQAIEKAKDDFMQLCKRHGFPTFNTERLRDTLPHPTLKRLIDLLQVGTTLEVGKAEYIEHVHQLSMNAQQKQRRQQELIAAEKYAAAKQKEQIHLSAKWSAEEDSALTKAMLRYPIGLKERWEKVTSAVNIACEKVSGGGQRTMEQVRKRSTELESEKSAAGSSDQAFSRYMSKLHVGANGDVSKSSPTKADINGTAESKQSDDDAAKEQLRIRQMDADLEKGKAAAADTKKATDDSEWSVDEQSLLEKGLKTFLKDSPTRWDDIADMVKTKNRKQCVARFKLLRERVKSKGAK